MIYTHYTTDFIQPIRKFVESKGFTTSLYSDNRDSRDDELMRFRNGDADIMIASDTVNTGVDRLQEVCDTMILITLPWTNADFEQLKGRIYRQGMDENSIVKIIIPQVIVHDADGKEWSWDKQRFDVIKYKKTLADCVIDGVIPQTQFYTRETLYRKSVLIRAELLRKLLASFTGADKIGIALTDLSINIEYKNIKAVMMHNI